MTVNQHKAFNRLLNSRVEESAHASYLSAPVRYAHTREIDTFHEVSVPGQGRRKVRVTRDQKDRSKVHAVEKMRVADMNVFSPKRRFDWRVSVSLEMPAPVPDTPPTHSRAKDRISYSHQLFQVDLTQVTSGAAQAKGAAGPTHELEIEVRKARPLLEEAAKEQRGEENRYLEMVQGLLNNVRMLIRNASDP
ncbi:mRNA-capping enzyme subunit beta [Rhodotorula kratochvilovae]